MPTLEALRSRGAQVEFDTPGQLLPDAVWAPLFSGGRGRELAVLHFEDFDPATMGTRFVHEAPAELEPFWLHLPEGTLAYELPEMHVHPDSRADEVCCYHAISPTHAPYANTTSVRRALEALPRPPALPYPSREVPLSDERAMSERLVRSARLRGEIVRALGRERDAVCVGFHEAHCALHWLGHHWEPGHWHAPEHPEPELVLRVYEAIDAALAGLLEDFDDANVVVVMARGMRPSNTAEQLLEELLDRAGLLVRRGAGIGPAGPQGRFSWLMQTGRQLVPARMRERLARRLLAQETQYRLASRRFSDSYLWSATKLFPVPSWTTGGLRLNLAGREAAGIVARADAEAVLEEAEALLAELEDAETGRPLVSNVLRSAAAFPGWTRLPELLVNWAADRPVLAARHPRFGEWRAEPRPTAVWTVHDRPAQALLAGPSVREDAGGRRDGDGLAATVLALQGIEAPRSIPGEPWATLAAPAGPVRSQL